MVRDKLGVKMSKSKGNVINPLLMVEKYGADSLRSALVFGTKEGNDTVLFEDKIIGMRNFANKIWNIGRFIEMNRSGNVILSKAKNPENNQNSKENADPALPAKDVDHIVKSLEKELSSTKKKYFRHMEKYQFSQALELLYQFIWHRIADFYIEELKDSLRNGNMKTREVLEKSYFESIAMLHPFMPFLTEAVWNVFHGEDSSLLTTQLTS
jgi:valyl-tRNA synthetase